LSKILIVDDDRDLLNACTVGLEALGHEVHTVVNGSEGLSTVAVQPPDVMVLDLGLPDLDGVEVCRRIRKWTDMPIIILSADGTEDRKVEALDNGADDYMTKPFGMRELDARVRATLRHRRNVDEQSTELDVGLLHIDLVHHEAIYDGGRLDLTPKEFEFLAYLSRHVGKVCTRRMTKKNSTTSRFTHIASGENSEMSGGAFCRVTHLLATGWYRRLTVDNGAGLEPPAPLTAACAARTGRVLAFVGPAGQTLSLWS
jgi:two-component system KDP operon response regulator KdpE